MDKLFEINFYQRTATGGVADGATHMYVVDDVLCNNAISVVSPREYKWLDAQHRVGMVHGYVQINHPSIMAGDWDEIVLAFKNAVLRELVSRGLVVVNDYGVQFWK